MHYFKRAVFLLPKDNLFDVVKLVQGFEWREVVDVETQDFVAYLTEYGVIELEEEEHPLMQQHLEYTLEQIATESGFQSISTFRRSFQKLKGVTPSEYRKGKQHY